MGNNQNNKILARIYNKLGKFKLFTKRDYEEALKETKPEKNSEEE